MRNIGRCASFCNLALSSSPHSWFHRNEWRCNARRPGFFGESVSLKRPATDPNHSYISRNIITAKKKDRIEKQKHDWEGLIMEFEERAEATEYPTSPPPPGVELNDEVVEDFEMLPLVEVSAMSAVTFSMWYVGRILRLDSFLLMFYPLPMFYATMRWGPERGDHVLLASLVLIFTMMGPLYAVIYLLNTGIMALVFSRVLWHRWRCLPAVTAGGLAKGVGLALQFTLMSGVIRENTWEFISFQVKYAVAIVLILHSLLHVLFTYLSSTMLLDRIGDSMRLKRKVRLFWLLQKLKDRVQSSSSRPY